MRPYGLGPFMFQNRWEEALQKELPFEEFAAKIIGYVQLRGSPVGPPTLTMRWLYEHCLRVRVQQETGRLAQKLVQTKKWRRAETRFGRLSFELRVFYSFDIEKQLRVAVRSQKRPRLASEVARLAGHMRQLEVETSLWKQMADWGSWQSEYREFVVAMGKILQKRLSAPLNSQIFVSEIIYFVVDWFGLRRTSPENIARMLRRAKNRARAYE
jgi:hypothetical protein